MEILVVVVSIQVEISKELVTPKLEPLIILEIGVGVEVTLFDIITHAFEVFKTPNIILKDTLAAERLGSRLVILVEPVDTTSEQHVDDLTARVKQIVLGD